MAICARLSIWKTPTVSARQIMSKVAAVVRAGCVAMVRSVPRCSRSRSKARCSWFSAPRPSRSTLNRPRSSTSSLSHWMTVRSAMRGVLDRHEVVHRLVAQQEAAGVDRQVAREVQDLVGQPQQVRCARGAWGSRPALARSAAVELAVVAAAAWPAGRARSPRQAQRLAHVAHGRARPVADDVGRPWPRGRARTWRRRAGSPPRAGRARCPGRCPAARRARARGSARTAGPCAPGRPR